MNNEITRIVGIDPGYDRVGWAILDFRSYDDMKLVDSGIISTGRKLQIESRYLILFNDMKELLAEYRPTLAGVETLLFAKNLKSAINVAQARGVILLTLRMFDICILSFTPLQVKKMLVGNGRADKRQMQRALDIILGGVKYEFDDTSDAVGISIVAGRSI